MIRFTAFARSVASQQDLVDALAQTRATGQSRRQVLRGLTALGIAAVSGASLIPESSAASRKSRRKHRKTRRRPASNHPAPTAIAADACASNDPTDCLPRDTMPDLYFSRTSLIQFDTVTQRYFVQGVTVANGTSVAAGSFQVAYLINGAVVKTFSIPGLAGNRTTVLARYDFPTTFRPSYECQTRDTVVFAIDRANTVREKSETNNTGSPASLLC